MFTGPGEVSGAVRDRVFVHDVADVDADAADGVIGPRTLERHHAAGFDVGSEQRNPVGRDTYSYAYAYAYFVRGGFAYAYAYEYVYDEYVYDEYVYDEYVYDEYVYDEYVYESMVVEVSQKPVG